MVGSKRRHSPQDHGYVEENATRRSGHTRPDAVNNRGLGFRGGKVWLPERRGFEQILHIVSLFPIGDPSFVSCRIERLGWARNRDTPETAGILP